MTRPLVWMPDACLQHERAIRPIADVVSAWDRKWFARRVWDAASPWAPELGPREGWTTLRDHDRVVIRGGNNSILRIAFGMLDEQERPNLSTRDLRLLRRLSNDALEDLLANLEAALPRGEPADAEQARWALAITMAGEPVLEILLNRADLSALCKRAFSPVRTSTALAPAASAVAHVPVSIAAHLGHSSLEIDQIQTLQPGDILLLDQLADEPIALVVAGRTSPLRGRIAEGNGIMELVMCESDEAN